MKINLYAFVVLVLVIMLAVAIPYFTKGVVYNRVYKAIEKKDFDLAIKRLNEKIYTVLFGKYDRDLMLLRVYLTTGDHKSLETHIMEMLTSTNLSGTQSYQAASMAYYFFIDMENKKMCEFLLPFMNKKRFQEEYAFASCLFRVLIEKRSDDIDSNKASLEQLKNDKKEDHTQQIGLYQYLIGVQYMYKKNFAEAKEYLNKARINLKGTPYHRKINAILNNCK